MDFMTLAMARKYVADTVNALGAVKGAPCAIKSITEVIDGSEITFEWTGTDGAVQQSSIVIPHGAAEATYVNVADGETIRLKNDYVFVAPEALTTLTITLPDKVDLAFRSAVIFECGDTATALAYPDTIVWSGDNLDSGLKFVPVHSKRYHIDVWYDGAYVRANASGVIVP